MYALSGRFPGLWLAIQNALFSVFHRHIATGIYTVHQVLILYMSRSLSVVHQRS